MVMAITLVASIKDGALGPFFYFYLHWNGGSADLPSRA